MTKIEVSDEFAKLWDEQGKLDAEIRNRGITQPVGFRQESPPDRHRAAVIAFTSLKAHSESLIEKRNDDDRKQALARKAADEAEKERRAHDGQERDAVGYYKKPTDERVRTFVFPVPPEPGLASSINSRLRSTRNHGSIFRVLNVEEGNNHLRVTYVPQEGAGSSDLDLLSIVYSVRNQQAVQEHSAVMARLKDSAGMEARRRIEAEEARWAAYSQ